MKTSIRNTLTVAALALGNSLFATNVYAVPINLAGSSSIGSSGATIAGSDLSAPGLITVTSPKYGLNTGDYSSITTDTVFNLAGPLDLGNLSSWNITGDAFVLGIYTVSELVVIDQSPAFLNIFTRGIFSPGNLPGNQAGGCARDGNTCAATDTSLRWTFSKTGDSVSAGGTLASPAVPLVSVPEPASLGLLGIGLIGCMVGRRKSANKAAATTQEGLLGACA